MSVIGYTRMSANPYKSPTHQYYEAAATTLNQRANNSFMDFIIKVKLHYVFYSIRIFKIETLNVLRR